MKRIITPEEDGITLLTLLKNKLKLSTRTVKTLKYREGGLKVNGEEVTVRRVLHGGENDERNVELYLIGVYPELYDATREGYVFRGWYDSISYNNKIESLFGVDESITLYALWVKGSTGGSGGSSTTTPEVPI